jgi:formylglycine-generating enzyme required for sulfatase activity
MPIYNFAIDGHAHTLNMVFVEGTHGSPYLFGESAESLKIEIQDFYISRFVVTQALWNHVMGDNPSIQRGNCRPVENVSWIEITRPNGFFGSNQRQS